jgi:hypothetical protein
MKLYLFDLMAEYQNGIRENMTIKIIRWISRITGGIILLFWGFIFLSDLFESSQNRSANPADFYDIAYLTLMVISIIGLAIAWKWELLGGIITLAAYTINVLINPRILVIYFHFILPLLGILFITVWNLSRKQNSGNGSIK